MTLDPGSVDDTLDRLAQRLLACRTAGGYWEGRLSSSALSTATSVIALSLTGRTTYHGLISGGLEWLARNQNTDGGWGDTTDSPSNISTTSLGWAAFSLASGLDAGSVRGAESWLRQAAGGLEPQLLSESIARRYGKDRTFSAPILMVLALAGRLGSGRLAWRWVPQLPFELAALPHRWFRWLGLPVVSYALPALIAIGQLRHCYYPSPNPLLSLLRRLTVSRTLDVLEQIQPSSGGFLEAVPLTSFVLMSLAAMDRADHPVVQRGIRFLERSVRPDGSWPIDTNLRTWVTTLSVNALSPAHALPPDGRHRICDWLLGQQYQQEHPYTGAAPGCWAWTDLPGGVPDADDTAGALLALRNLGVPDDRVRQAAGLGVHWLLQLQNRDGGIPTFCRGWGKLPFDRSSPDLTAHALLAWTAWREDLPPELRNQVTRATRRAFRYLAQRQRTDGAWVPLWFGNQFAPDEANPLYGTARVLAALRGLEGLAPSELPAMMTRATQWLLAAQNPDGGWGGDRGIPSSIEETGLALAAIGRVPESEAVESAVLRGAAWLVARTNRGSSAAASPIGLYFARLWYSEDLYPLIFAVAGLANARHTLQKPHATQSSHGA